MVLEIRMGLPLGKRLENGGREGFREAGNILFLRLGGVYMGGSVL